LADFRRGIKAGVVAATVYLIISVILATIGREFWYPSGFISAAGLSISLESTDSPFMIYSILSYIVRGIIFGAVFAALYDFLPGTTSVKKGVMFSAFLWILGAVGLIYITPGWPTDGGQVYTVTGPAGLTICLSSICLALVSIISALVFGTLVGAIWNKLREKKVTEVSKGIAALLVSFILGGVYWVSGAVAFFIGVVIRGAPLIEEPGPFWWGNILYASVIFLGLPGWVLALVAWRKTKRGESGLKWGVAGGVIMALTCLMLLPGVLAIIGGVLSGRKPASESSTAEIEQ
jgi:hypothetical protein